MNCSDALELLVTVYSAGQVAAAELPDEVVAHFATCPACLDDLAGLGFIFTGDTPAWLAQLVATPGPEVATAHPAPHTMTFAEKWRRDHLWQVIATKVHQLAGEIMIRIGQTSAVFDALPAFLQPQLAPAPVQRNQASETMPHPAQRADELLELPHPEANLLIRVNMASVVDGKGALVLEVRRITPSRPIEQVKITLRDQGDDLLERTTTDQDGLATFEGLAAGKYTVVVEHASQTWRFGLTLSAQTSTVP